MTGAIIGLLIHAVFNLSRIHFFLLSGLLGAVLIVAMIGIGQLLFKQQAMGSGDIKLMAVVGWYVGLSVVFPVFLLSVLCGALWGVGRILMGIYLRIIMLPFAPFVFAGYMIYMLPEFLN